MNPSKKIIWSRTSIAHFANWILYIARDSNKSAAHEKKSLLHSVARLGRFPNSGRIVPEFNNPYLREVIHGSIRIIYRVVDKEIHLLAFHHSSRPLDQDLFP